MRVELEAPSNRREDEFLSAVRRSRRLHGTLVTPPRTPAKYRTYVESSQSERHANFLVIHKAGGDLVGVVNIENIVRGFCQAGSLGYYAFAPHAGKGLMREGIELAIDHAFGELGLHRLEANIQSANARSKALVARLGFEFEGYSRGYLKIGGRWRDHERWALLSEEWTGPSGSD